MHILNYPAWAVDRMGLSGVTAFDVRKAAPIVVDLQKAFLDRGSPLEIPSAIDIVPNVNRLIAGARAGGIPVIFLRHTISDQPPYVLPRRALERLPQMAMAASFLTVGLHTHAIHESLDLEPDDVVVDKHRYSAMLPNSSQLHPLLQARGIEKLIICGAATHACCESTARDAAMRDYHVIMVSDATATLSDELHAAALAKFGMNFGEVGTTATVLAMLADVLAIVLTKEVADGPESCPG